METIKKEIDEAYAILSTIYVNGDAVDMVASVRAKLRKAANMLKDEIEDKKYPEE